jgi:folate-binding protein YgfZ
VTTAPIDSLGVLAIRGADAVPFSHSQLANDVKALANGHWHWNCLLQIQGRVLALMLLARLADDEVLLVLPREIRGDVAATLSRYVLRSKVRLVEDDDLAIFGTAVVTEPPAEDAVSVGGRLAHDGRTHSLELGGRLRRVLSIGPAGHGAGVPVDAVFRHGDVVDGIPWIRSATSGEFIPQALGLARLGAFSVSKGCYPGQEIVARTHFLGRNKRTLMRIAGPRLEVGPAPGDRLHGGSAGQGDPVAIVIDAVALRDETVGLAVARDIAIRDGWWRRSAWPVHLRLSEA